MLVSSINYSIYIRGNIKRTRAFYIAAYGIIELRIRRSMDIIDYYNNYEQNTKI